MKLKKLLVLSALCLSFSSAMAAIVDGVRVKPTPSATQGFVVSESTDTYFYLYNVDAQAFFTEGNAWGTQVSLGSTGLKAAFTPDGTYDLTYLFNDFSIAKNAWKLVFFDNENQMFVDLGSQANYRWGVEDNGETFRLYAASEENGNPGWAATTDEDGNEVLHPAYREGQYMGWDKASSGNTCVPYLTVADGHCINWAFVTEEVYTAYQAEIVCYEAAEKLKKAIDDAKAKGFTETAAYETLYANEAATKAELEKGLSDLNDAIVEWGKNNATVDNPADMTAKIKNPRFDGDDLSTGWSTKFNANGGKENAEYWNMNYDTHQDIVGLPEGVYALGVKAFYRAGSNSSSAIQNWLEHNEASKYAKLYATAGENTRETPIANVFSGAETEPTGENGEAAGGDVKVTYTDENGEEVSLFVPNNMSRAEYFMHTLGKYDNKLMFSVSEGQTVTIGVKKTVNISDEWSIFDDFSLTYYGKGADAYQLMLNEALKDYNDITLDEGTLYTESYFDAYKEALAGEKVATNQAEVDAIFGAIDGAYQTLQKNIELWKTWQKNLEDAYTKYATDEVFGNMIATGVLTDYYEMDEAEDGGPGKETIEAEHNLTNEQLEAEIARIAAMAEAIEKEAKEGLKPNTDVTKFMVNPDFEGGVKRGVADPNGHTGDYGTAVGWHADKFANGNFTPGPDGKDNDPTVNHCFETWHCWDFDLWQEVTNVPEGVYVIEVQGYVRPEISGYTQGDPVDPSIIPIKLYMNNATATFPSIYSEQVAEEHYLEDGTLPLIESHSWNGTVPNYPNSMGAAGLCFSWGMYKMQAYGLVKAGESMRIGVKGKMNDNWWCIWDNFKLTYQGYEVNYVQPALEDAMTQINSNQPMGKSLYAQALGLEAKAAEAKATGDGKTMFNMLAEIYDVAAAISTSVENFTKLQSAAEALNDAAFLSANATAKAEAEALAAEISNGIASYSYEDADVEGLMDQIAKATTKLNMPEDMASASDADPKECTKVIKTPGFENEEDYTNSSAGWTNPGNLGNDDTQKTVLAMEFWQSAFDMYQTIVGLPKGTYKLTVDAWCRAGNNDENFTGWQGNPEHTMAFLYAVDGDSTVYSAPVANVMKGLVSENPGIEGVDEITLGEVTYYMPNSLVGGRSYMDIVEEGTYTNSVICKVGDDGKLTVGIKKPEQKDNSWVVLDNFRLFYLGANSSAEVSGDAATAISTLDAETPVKVEFFNLSGARISKPGKGVAIMKQTLSDGSVKLQKVIVK